MPANDVRAEMRRMRRKHLNDLLLICLEANLKQSTREQSSDEEDDRTLSEDTFKELEQIFKPVIEDHNPMNTRAQVVYQTKEMQAAHASIITKGLAAFFANALMRVKVYQKRLNTLAMKEKENANNYSLARKQARRAYDDGMRDLDKTLVKQRGDMLTKTKGMMQSEELQKWHRNFHKIASQLEL